ncbi:hypothetical protein [Pantoea sp. C2G6]|uniref:hypothetical protein n=1 Tax=Pantoea sp. C2G6 TaxID=3243084 RepID=UPI003ED9636C
MIAQQTIIIMLELRMGQGDEPQEWLLLLSLCSQGASETLYRSPLQQPLNQQSPCLG